MRIKYWFLELGTKGKDGKKLYSPVKTILRKNILWGCNISGTWATKPV